MHSTYRTIEADVCVVGGGLLGLAHAHAARGRGLSVVVLERDSRPLGGSIRHGGHLFFSALPGEASQLAAQARASWSELLARAGAFSDDCGTVIVARSDDELAVMAAAVRDRPGSARMLSPAQVAKLVPIPTRGLAGALHGLGDLRVDPRTVAAAIARLLARDPAVRIEWRTPAQIVEPGLVLAGELRLRARAVVVCPGAETREIPVALGGEGTLRRQRVHMLRVAPPGHRRYRPALATSLTLLEQPGFAGLPGAEALRARIELEHEQLIEHGVAPVITQLPGGELIVGPSSVPETVPSPFGNERSGQRLLAAAQALLGGPCDVRERWLAAGLSAAAERGSGGSRASSDNFHVSAPLPGVRVVRAVGPLALALCHVQASDTLDGLLAPAPDGGSADGFALRDQRRVPLGVRAHPQAFRALRARPAPPA